MFEELMEEDARPMGLGAMRPAVDSIHGAPGGSLQTGLALVRGGYAEQPLLPGGSVESGMAAAMPALNPNVGYYPGYPSDQAMFARGLTSAEAVIQAKQQLCALSGSWCTATDAQVIAHIQQDPTIFVCPNPIRCVLAPTTCTSAQCGSVVPPPAGADNTLLYVAGGVVGIALLALLMSRGGRRPMAPVPVGR